MKQYRTQQQRDLDLSQGGPQGGEVAQTSNSFLLGQMSAALWGLTDTINISKEPKYSTADVVNRVLDLHILSSDLAVAASRTEEQDLRESLFGAVGGILEAAAAYNMLVMDWPEMDAFDDDAMQYLKWVGKVNKALDALDMVSALADQEVLYAFLDEPTYENGKAWAVHTAAIFDKAANLVPDEIPFIGTMARGLLSAPVHYIDAVINAYDYYIERTDDYIEDADRPTIPHGYMEDRWRSDE